MRLVSRARRMHCTEQLALPESKAIWMHRSSLLRAKLQACKQNAWRILKTHAVGRRAE